jgi:hypothetical protein
VFESTEIGGKTFKCEKMASLDSLDYMVRISKLLGGVLKASSEDDDDAKGTEGLVDFIATLDAKETKALARELVAMTVCDGDKSDANVHCDGLSELFQVIIFVMKVNYSSFLAEGADKIPGLKGLVKNFSVPKE